jgi:hypothetical protein
MESSMEKQAREIHLVFDAPPGRDMPTLLEVEDETGRSIDCGDWRERPDGYWELVLPAAPKGLW